MVLLMVLTFVVKRSLYNVCAQHIFLKMAEQLKMVLIKCCDISNEVRPTEVAEPWVDCLLEEYFMQVTQPFCAIRTAVL